MDCATVHADIHVMSRTILSTGLLLSLVVALPTAAGRSTHDFAKHTFSLDLPEGYTFQAEAKPRPESQTFGFTTEPRSDGTRGMIQVTLLDLTQAPPGETLSVDRLAGAMIDGVKKRRTRWEQVESDVHVGNVPAKRIAWSGSVEPGFGRPPIYMRGVMIAGIAKDLAFVLHTQDVTAFADTTLPLCEQALLTFAAKPRR
jgi:hypothetical protein